MLKLNKTVTTLSTSSQDKAWRQIKILFCAFAILYSWSLSAQGVKQEHLFHLNEQNYRLELTSKDKELLYSETSPVFLLLDDFRGEIGVHNKLQNIALYRNDTLLHWNEAKSVIVSNLAFQWGVDDIFRQSKKQWIRLPSGHNFFVPDGLRPFSLRLSLTDKQIKNTQERAQIYTEVFLDIFSQSEWLALNDETLLKARANAYLISQFASIGENAQTIEWLLKQKELLKAPKHSIAKLFNTKAKLENGRMGKILGVAQIAFGAIANFEEARQKTILLQFALSKVKDLSVASKLIAHLQNSDIDPALLLGAKRAFETMQQSTLNQIQALQEGLLAGGISLAKDGAIIFASKGAGMLAKGLIGTKAVAGVVGSSAGLLVVGFDVYDYGQKLYYLSALGNANLQIASLLHTLARDKQGDLASIASLNHYAAWRGFVLLENIANPGFSLSQLSMSVKHAFDDSFLQALDFQKKQTLRSVDQAKILEKNLPAVMGQFRDLYARGGVQTIDHATTLQEQKNAILNKILKQTNTYIIKKIDRQAQPAKIVKEYIVKNGQDKHYMFIVVNINENVKGMRLHTLGYYSIFTCKYKEGRFSIEEHYFNARSETDSGLYFNASKVLQVSARKYGILTEDEFMNMGSIEAKLALHIVHNGKLKSVLDYDWTKNFTAQGVEVWRECFLAKHKNRGHFVDFRLTCKNTTNPQEAVSHIYQFDEQTNKYQ